MYLIQKTNFLSCFPFELGRRYIVISLLSDVLVSSSIKVNLNIIALATNYTENHVFFFSILIALPKEGPQITGGRPRYQIGDTVRVNCTSGRSKPAAQLMWFINGDQVS